MSESLSARVAKIRQDQSDKVFSPFERCARKIHRVRGVRDDFADEKKKAALPAPAGPSEKIFSYHFDRDLYTPPGTTPDEVDDGLYRDPYSYPRSY